MPPSEVIRPPSKAALTCFRTTAGRSKGSGILFSIGVCHLIAVLLRGVGQKNPGPHVLLQNTRETGEWRATRRSVRLREQ